MHTEIISIIKEAGEILKKGYFSPKNITHKSARDLVTEFDLKVEAFLKEKFSRLLPQFSIIAEESDNKDVIFNDSIIIDPIDGTTNFIHGIPFTCISVGIYKNKQPWLGIVYNPILNELFFAEQGKGAYLNDHRIQTCNTKNLESSLIVTGFPVVCATDNQVRQDVLQQTEKLLTKCMNLRRLGSAALDLCYVAKGTFAAFVEMNLKPWDVSAGMLILQEAGGKITNISGKEFDMFTDNLIVATNKNIHHDLIDLLSN